MASNKGGATRSCTLALLYRDAGIGDSRKTKGLPKMKSMLFGSTSIFTNLKWKYRNRDLSKDDWIKEFIKRK